MTAERRHRNGDPARCCVGDPWPWFQAHVYTADEPLHPDVIEVAAARGIDPHDLDWHVEAEHGWESHDDGYRDAVDVAAGCLTSGWCEVNSEPAQGTPW